MLLNKHLKEEHLKLSRMPAKDRLWYIKEYYKFHILAFIIIIWLIAVLGRTFYAGTFNSVFSCMIINDSSNGESDISYIEEGFSDYLSLGRKETISIESGLSISFGDDASEFSYASMAKLAARVADNDLDTLITDSPVIEHFAASGGLYDLEKLLPADLLAVLKDRLFYSVNETGEPYACGIYLDSTPLCEKTGLKFDSPLLGIIVNSNNTDNSIKFLRYLFEV